MINRGSLLAYLLLVLLTTAGHAQEIRISGRVVEAKTKEPVPFASISLRTTGTGALTNEQGEFRLAGSKSVKQDSIVVMTLGYERYAAFIESNNSNTLTIELIRRNVEALRQELICRPLTARDIKPIVESERITGASGTQYAFFIGNEKQKKLGKLRTVSFYIGANGLPMESFRIRIYKANGDNHSPNTNLLNEEVFFMAPQAGEWYTSDLSRYNIAAPQEGYFVALEFGKLAEGWSQPTMEHYATSGLIMRPPFEIEKSIIWIYSPEKGWNLFPRTNGSRRYNVMVRAEVETVD